MSKRKRSIERRSHRFRFYLNLTGRGVAFALVLLPISACVEITSTRQNGNDNIEKVAGAIPYVLPMATFLITATYTLNCSDNGTQQVPQITPTFAMSQVNMPDMNERYYINSEDLKSWLKDSQITVNTNPNQTISSANGTVNDLAGPDIATAVGVAAGVAGAVFTAGAGAPVELGTGALLATDVHVPAFKGLFKFPPPKAPKLTCGAPLNDQTAAAINQLLILRAKITDRLADPSKPSTTTDPELGIYFNQIADLSLQALTIKTSYVWTPYPNVASNSGKSKSSPNPTPDENGILKAHFDDTSKLINHWFVDNTEPAIVERMSTLPLADQLELRFVSWSYNKEGPAPVLAETKGFVLRQPAIGTLRMCGTKCQTPGQKTTGSDGFAPTVSFDNTTTVAELDNINIPQFGRRLIAPFRNIMFQNTTIAFALGADGSITSLGTHDMSTSNSFLTTLGSSVQSVSGAFAARATAIGANNTAIGAANTAAAAVAQYADVALKAQADCITQRNTIIAAGAIPVVQCTNSQ